MKESGAHAVKLEGGNEIIDSIERILTAGIPVMGHIGLLPQSSTKYKLNGKNLAQKRKILEDAMTISNSGVFSIVVSEITIRYSTINSIYLTIFLSFPFFLFTIIYLYLIKKLSFSKLKGI